MIDDRASADGWSPPSPCLYLRRFFASRTLYGIIVMRCSDLSCKFSDYDTMVRKLIIRPLANLVYGHITLLRTLYIVYFRIA